jgi:complement component 1 Q subcomponent-binding protein
MINWASGRRYPRGGRGSLGEEVGQRIVCDLITLQGI